MKAKQEDIIKQREKKLAQKQLEREQEKQRQLEAKQAEKTKQRRQIQALSFSIHEDNVDNLDEEDDLPDNEEEEIVMKPVAKKIRKNPDVDTSFLPDRYNYIFVSANIETYSKYRNLLPRNKSFRFCILNANSVPGNKFCFLITKQIFSVICLASQNLNLMTVILICKRELNENT